MDTYVILLTPVFILAMLALVRFVGCATFGSTDDSGPAVPPNITSVDPASLNAGGPIFTLTVNGTGFVNENVQSIVQWNGAERYTTFFDSTKLTATILAADIANPGSANVSVNNKDALTGTGTASNAVAVTINPPSGPPPAPALVTLTFDNDALGGPPPGGPGALNGVYKTLDFGTGVWIWTDPFGGGGPANAATFTTGSQPAGDIKFAPGHSPRVLRRIRVFPKRAANVSITDSGSASKNPTVNAAFKAADANSVHFIDTGWTSPTDRFTIATDIGFDLLVDTIIYEGPA